MTSCALLASVLTLVVAAETLSPTQPTLAPTLPLRNYLNDSIGTGLPLYVHRPFGFCRWSHELHYDLHADTRATSSTAWCHARCTS